MSNNCRHYYAVTQEGYAVFGIGTSKAAAISDAKQWVDGELHLSDDVQPADGEMVLVECTKDLFDRVNDCGGDIFYTQLDNGLYGLGGEAA